MNSNFAGSYNIQFQVGSHSPDIPLPRVLAPFALTPCSQSQPAGCLHKTPSAIKQNKRRLLSRPFTTRADTIVLGRVVFCRIKAWFSPTHHCRVFPTLELPLDCDQVHKVNLCKDVRVVSKHQPYFSKSKENSVVFFMTALKVVCCSEGNKCWHFPSKTPARRVKSVSEVCATADGFAFLLRTCFALLRRTEKSMGHQVAPTWAPICGSERYTMKPITGSRLNLVNPSFGCSPQKGETK